LTIAKLDTKKERRKKSVALWEFLGVFLAVFEKKAVFREFFGSFREFSGVFSIIPAVL